MSPPLRFEAGDEAGVAELDDDALGALASGESAASPWTIAEEPDWAGIASLRLLAAQFADGSVTALLAARPARAEGHDADLVAAVLVDPGGDVSQMEQVLLSTELDAEDRVRRVGVELWRSEEPPPYRLAADRLSFEAGASAGHRRESVLMRARLDGQEGTAMFERLTPAGES